MSVVPINNTVSVRTDATSETPGLQNLVGCIVTPSVRETPISKPHTFYDLQSVSESFPADTDLYEMAEIYFAGINGSISLPAKLVVYEYNKSAFDDGQGGIDVQTIMNNASQYCDEFHGVFISDTLSSQNQMDFAEWIGSTDNSVWGIIPDNRSDITQATQKDCIGQKLLNSTISGVTACFPDAHTASFLLAWMASLDFSQEGGQTNLAGRSSPVLGASVTDLTSAENLTANGYTFIDVEGNGSERFIWCKNGFVSGGFRWADTYVDQIYIMMTIQNDLANLIKNSGNIPFNAYGDALIEASVLDSIQSMINFGMISQGVNISKNELVKANQIAGRDIHDVLYARGYYFHAGASDASSDDRSQRKIQSTLIYTADQSVQTISMYVLGVE